MQKDRIKNDNLLEYSLEAIINLNNRLGNAVNDPDLVLKIDLTWFKNLDHFYKKLMSIDRNLNHQDYGRQWKDVFQSIINFGDSILEKLYTK